jgi:hypothetical protein
MSALSMLMSLLIRAVLLLVVSIAWATFCAVLGARALIDLKSTATKSSNGQQHV